ncbi:MAG TPA: BatD family protein [Acetivibrio saccincola]|uniref:BatD family protein n=1 Tax=Acetivibrio saccincola TaxID=1677857 RepID=UPI002C4A7C5D|nr:BatD family protein [Acetivibrio saccincola]HOA97236.1 BatD family protein [Acetivibrio saccincola]HQD28669.1 BatD family protein [Acetivibrio saccincola]
MAGKKTNFKIVFITTLLITFLLAANIPVWGNTPEFRLDIDSLKLSRGESTTLAVSIVNAQNAEIVDIEGIDNFRIVSTSTSDGTQIINSQVTHTRTYRHVIIPKFTGEFTLVAKIRYNGSIYETNELTVTVTDSPPAEEEEAKDLFIKTVLSENEIYYGQKAVLTYEFYSRFNIERLGFLDDIKLDSFITQEIENDNLSYDFLYINGKRYVKYIVKQIFLTPIKAGSFEIPQYTFQANVSTGGFFDSSKPYYLETEPVELKVNPLPTDNKPTNFSGLVGNLNITSNYTKQQIDIKDSLTLEVTLSGDCDLENFKNIIQDEIPGFSVYETEKNSEEGVEDNKYFSKKEFEIILVPEKTGELEIPPININYFDTRTKTYKNLEIPGATITVTGNMPQSRESYDAPASADVEQIKIEQISYKNKDNGYMTIKLKKSVLYTVLIALSLLAIIVLSIIFITISKKKGDKNLGIMYKKIKKSTSIEEIYNVFNDMIKYCFNLSIKAGTRAAIKEKLSPYGISNSVLEVVDCVEGKNSDISTVKGKIHEVYKALSKLKR